MSEVCANCGRSYDEHSVNTGDICNFFIPVQRGKGDAGGTRETGVALGDDASARNVREAARPSPPEPAAQAVTEESLARLLRTWAEFGMTEGLNEQNSRACARAIIALRLPQAGKTEAEWRHKKRGTTYRILHGEEYADCTGSSASNWQMDDEPMVVYQDTDSGRVWVRPRSEFFDGRFERLPAPPITSGGDNAG